jgi:hypothetical protein
MSANNSSYSASAVLALGFLILKIKGPIPMDSKEHDIYKNRTYLRLQGPRNTGKSWGRQFYKTLAK